MASTYTYTVTQLTVWGNKRVHLLTYTVTNYDQTGKIPLTPAMAGLSILDNIIGITMEGTTGVVANGPVAFCFDRTGEAIMAKKDGATEVDDNTNISTAGTILVVVMGS